MKSLKRLILALLPVTILYTLPIYASGNVSGAVVDENTNAAYGSTPFDAFVSSIYNSRLFQRYISTWGAPLNNASFIAVLLIIVFILIILSIVELVLNWRKSKQIYKVNEEKLEKRRQQEAEDELLREYMRFKMLAETNGVDGMQTVSFEQWLSARVETGQVDMANLTPEQREAVAEAREVAADVKETITEAVNSALPKKQPQTEEEAMDAAIAEREAEDDRIQRTEEYQQKQAEQLQAMRANGQTVAQTVSPVNPTTKPQRSGSWLDNVEEIKKKYSTDTKKTELVDLPDADETVHLSKAAVVKPITLKEKPKTEEVKPKQAKVDVNKLLEEKTAEMKDDMGEKVSHEEMTQFDALVASLNSQKAAESKAKALSAEAEKAKEANIELLQNDIEDSLEGTAETATTVKQQASKENKALEEAKRKALKEMQRESARRRK